jgi:hypothetical protein
MDANMKTYRIKDWDDVFENHESRKLKSLRYVSWPARSDSEAFTRLMRTPEGVLAFGVFSALVSVAAKMTPRGVLADDKGPLDAERLATRIGAPEAIVASAIDLLASKKIGWLQDADETESDSAVTEAPRESPAISRLPGDSGTGPFLSSPLPSGIGISPPSKNTRPSADVSIPDSLNTPAFTAAWDEWAQHRREKRAKLTATAAKRQLAKFAEWGEARAIAAIHHSIQQGWTGIFEPDTAGKVNPRESDGERTLRILRERQTTGGAA